ncbi:NAD(P)H-dependent flavin oxidoreductase [Virgibacillus ainsalahensis]
MLTNEITELLEIKYPIIQAPMAGGITTSTLVSEVSNSGGLGMIGVGGMPSNQMREQIREVKQLTSNNFGINLFVPGEFTTSDSEIEETTKLLDPLFRKLDIQQNEVDLPSSKRNYESFQEKVEIIAEERVPVCSFIFGIPPKEVITKLKGNGIIVIGTATTVHEAVEIENAGLDAVVVQGSEAGGHRGTFAGEVEESLIGLMSLLPQAANHVTIPIIAAGGIMDGRGLAASLCLGAKGVQMGTAFLTTIESGAHPLHKEAILDTSKEQTVLTRSFTGKFARAIKNSFVSDLQKHEGVFPDFPIHRVLAQPIVKASQSQNNPEYMLLLSGQSPGLAKHETVQTLMANMITEAKKMNIDL